MSQINVFTAGPLKNLPVFALRPLAEQPAIRTKTSNIRGLGQNLGETMTMHPLAVVDNGDETYTIADGHRRWTIAQEHEATSLPCIVYPTNTDALELFVRLNRDTRRIGGREWLQFWSAVVPSKRRAILKTFSANERRRILDLLSMLDGNENELVSLAERYNTSSEVANVVQQVRSFLSAWIDKADLPTPRTILYWVLDNEQQTPYRRFRKVEVQNKGRGRAAAKELLEYIIQNNPIKNYSSKRRAA